MQVNVDIHELNRKLLKEASTMAAQNPHEAMLKFKLDKETCHRLALMNDVEISHVSKTNLSLFSAEIGFCENGV